MNSAWLYTQSSHPALLAALQSLAEQCNKMSTILPDCMMLLGVTFWKFGSKAEGIKSVDKDKELPK